MNILITGAGGFVGSNLIRQLRSTRKFNLTCIVRKAYEHPDNKDCRYYAENISDKTDWSSYLKNVDVVIHLAALTYRSSKSREDLFVTNIDATVNLSRQCIAHGVKRFIFVSSAGVYGKFSRNFVVENVAPLNPSDDYSVSKLIAEQKIKELCQDSPMSFTILRPSLIYGETDIGSLKPLAHAVKRSIPLPLANISNSRSFLYIKNFVTAIEGCILADDHTDHILNVCDDDTLSTTDLTEIIATALSKKLYNFYIPKIIMKTLLKVLGRETLYQQLYESLRLDNGKIKQYIDWSPVYSTKRGITLSINPHTATQND